MAGGAARLDLQEGPVGFSLLDFVCDGDPEVISPARVGQHHVQGLAVLECADQGVWVGLGITGAADGVVDFRDRPFGRDVADRHANGTVRARRLGREREVVIR